MTAESVVAAALQRVRPGRLRILTGAGVSTDSDIPDYRGVRGTYTLRPHHRPTTFYDFVHDAAKRERYWARSFLAFPRMQRAKANATHRAIQSLVDAGYLPATDGLITQNVDRLHWQAGTHGALELHGTLWQVHCLSCRHTIPRHTMQETLHRLNADTAWAALFARWQASVRHMNADGDAELAADAMPSQPFAYPSCPSCGEGTLKPSVVFFGENIDAAVRDRATATLASDIDLLLVIGSSLTTYSAFRLVKQVLEAPTQARVVLVNQGQTRAHTLLSHYPDRLVHVDAPCLPVMRDVQARFAPLDLSFGR